MHSDRDETATKLLRSVGRLLRAAEGLDTLGGREEDQC
jgi:hypothetical protein